MAKLVKISGYTVTKIFISVNSELYSHANEIFMLFTCNRPFLCSSLSTYEGLLQIAYLWRVLG